MRVLISVPTFLLALLAATPAVQAVPTAFTNSSGGTSTGLDLSDLGIVGVVNVLENDPANVGQAAIKAQALLDLIGLGATSGIYQSGLTYDYSGTILNTLTNPGKRVDSTGVITEAGWEYAIAKYDGQNAGYVMFYLGGTTPTLPTYPYAFWTDKAEQYGISGYTLFNKKSSTSNVPDGGMTGVLLGGALLVAAAVRRRFIR